MFSHQNFKFFFFSSMALAFSLALLPFFGEATSFLPLPMKDHLLQADGVVVGTFDKEVYKRNSDGQVVTEASFKLERQAGIEKDHLLNPYAFTITLPGGKWGGLIYRVHGVPQFKKGEKAVLILKKNRFGLVLANLSLSKFNFVQKNGKTYLVSQIFPELLNVGRMEWQTFERMVEDSFPGGFLSTEQRVFRSISSQRKAVLAVNSKQKITREPASSEKEGLDLSQEEAEISRSPSSSSNNMFWPILILGLLGGFFIGPNKAQD